MTGHHDPMSPSSLDPHNRREYRRRASGIEFLGALLLIAGAYGLLAPSPLEESVLASSLSRTARIIWLSLYAGGGALVLTGLYWPKLPRPELEGLGLWLIIGGLATNVLVLFYLRGPIPDGASLTTIAALVLSGRLALRRLGDLERARITDRRQMDLGARARSPRLAADARHVRDGEAVK
jgi:hypothetical protein